MRLADLVATSLRVGRTRSRLEKVGRLAELLHQLRDAELTPAVSWLAGRLPQGRIGLGPAALREARTRGSQVARRSPPWRRWRTGGVAHGPSGKKAAQALGDPVRLRSR